MTKQFILIAFLFVGCSSKPDNLSSHRLVGRVGDNGAMTPEGKRDGYGFYGYTDHMGMRAITTKNAGAHDMGCKNGHLWKLLDSNDKWGDIGLVTDSCNCNTPLDSFEPMHKPGNQEVLYVVIAITDSSIYLPAGFPQYAAFKDSFVKIHPVPPDGMGVLALNSFPQKLVARGFMITFQKLDTVFQEGFYKFGKF